MTGMMTLPFILLALIIVFAHIADYTKNDNWIYGGLVSGLLLVTTIGGLIYIRETSE